MEFLIDAPRVSLKKEINESGVERTFIKVDSRTVGSVTRYGEFAFQASWGKPKKSYLGGDLGTMVTYEGAILTVLSYVADRGYVTFKETEQ